jgi:WD40 repeat protein
VFLQVEKSAGYFLFLLNNISLSPPPPFTKNIIVLPLCIHIIIIDCVQFIGDLILSKSAVSNVIVLWKPVVTATSIKAVYTTTRTIPSNIIFLREFQLDNCSSWYIRFECPGPDNTILACGNEFGEVRVWQIDDGSELLENDDINYTSPDYTHSCSLTTSTTLSSITGDRDNLSTVRMVAFNPYGSQLVAVRDDSTIWMWDSLG